ncbi:MAG: hypothetical protein V8T86_12765 [Victivallis sp.]
MCSLFLEAESFRAPGGWVIDPSAMHEMGSAYLMAHGIGTPVADAVTEIEIVESAVYHIRARTRDWTAVWKRGTPAGRFTLRIDGFELPEILGTNGEKWAWQKPGPCIFPPERTPLPCTISPDSTGAATRSISPPIPMMSRRTAEPRWNSSAGRRTGSPPSTIPANTT